MKIENMHDLFVSQIEDLYDAEQRLVKALPKMAEASSGPLRQAIESHLQETRGQVQRLERIFTLIGIKAKGETCDAMRGLITEGEEAISDTDQKSPLRDAAIIAAANRVEHYEIAAYGSARAFAENLGMKDAAQLLQQTLEEEKRADQKLTSLATTVNQQAAHASMTR
jgi:ferritin-like metal-binding protein YciE